MNTAEVIQLINLLLGVVITSAEAIRRYQALVERARAEGRDVSDEELAALRAESDRLTEETLALLQQPHRDPPPGP